jgi:hypothetical protein
VAASSLQGTPTHRRRLGWALGEEGGGSESLRRGPRPPYLTGKASSMRGGGAVMSAMAPSRRRQRGVERRVL